MSRRYITVAYLNKCVVKNEHDGSKPPSPSAVPIEHLPNIADIFHFRVPETELPEDSISE